ncbi:MAG TPA: aminotransferase class I/II-fold pyridoxal phosphate-dependent enzyme [Candidatus Saccharimonadales bacterium]|nr:aminotransferase class I/II-fold pyridoxal phosphate-dependent enzyme [Candidatus Saccharimonadales bacterium]
MERFNDLPDATIDQIMLANAKWPDFLKKYPDAINTTIGVMIDPVSQAPWQPATVKQARAQSLQEILDKGEFGYQGQAGNADFLAASGKQVFGETTYASAEHGIMGYQALGGTGALSLAKDLLANTVKPSDQGQIPLVLDTGWPNHPAIFTEPFAVTNYAHQDPVSGAYNHAAALEAFLSAPENSVFLLQTCGYNDDGMDRSPQQWDEVLQIATDKQATVILDSAYMGLVSGFEQERYPIEQSLSQGLLTLVCFSASKNMGMYNDRVGALFVGNAGQNLGKEQASRLNQVASRIIRRTISNAPLLAAKAAARALNDESYLVELTEARGRLNANRQRFADIVKDVLPAVAQGRGLFTKLYADGFSEAQQKLLAEEHILALPNSRINLGGLHADQVERVANAVLRAAKLV